MFYHEQRMNRSLQMLFGDNKPVELENFLREKEIPETGLFKCRIVYDNVMKEASFTPYVPREIKRVKVVRDNDISYDFKFSDRGTINRLFELRGNCDDVLIIRRDRVTDCSYSNIVFRKGKNWYTPSDALLKGTMRQHLIDENKITVREIGLNDIVYFETFKIINAMLGFDSPEIEVSDIVF